MKLFSVLFAIIVVAFHANGQRHLASGTLPSIQEDNFYRIQLGPEISAYLEEDFANLRIIDDKGVQLPYLLETEEAVEKSEFVEYEFERKVIDKCCTQVIVKNQGKRSVNNLNVRVVNADVVKRAKLVGSDDGKTWYALRDEFTLRGAGQIAETSELKTVEFPLSDYGFFRLELEDSTTAPLNITTVGYYKTYQRKPAMDKLEQYAIERRDSASSKQTYLRISFSREQWLDELGISGKSNTFFLRDFTVALMHRYSRKKREYLRLDPIATGKLSHENMTTISLEPMRVKEIYIVLENADNIPLDDFVIELKQRKRSAIAWLSTKNTYQVIAGDSAFLLPSYDLANFKEKIPAQLQTLAIADVREQSKDQPTKEISIFNKYWLWIGLTLIMGTLGFLSIRIIREMKSAKI